MKHYQFSDFSQIILDGPEETRQQIPWSEDQRASCRFGIFTIEAFENDMAAYARKSYPKDAPPPTHATFIHFSPTYRNMSQAQRSWYLYWRGQVRGGSYPETDYPYIQLYATELISGYGWDSPEDGYGQLLKLWEAYRGRYSTMDSRFLIWSFDFAMEHGVEFRVPEALGSAIPPSPVQQNMLFSQHASDRILKLPYSLILTLSDYSPERSGFWKDGHAELIREAVFRSFSLCDALKRKETGNSLLSALAPIRAKTISYTPYEGAFCEKSAYSYNIPMIDYTGGRTLRAYVTELVRFVENVLRDMKGYRGKLKDVTFDPETGVMVEQFLRKNMTQQQKPPAPAAITLDISQIEKLRAESDAVRDALDVPDAADFVEETDNVPVTTEPIIATIISEADSASESSGDDLFDRDRLSPELCEIIAALHAPLVKVLHAVLTGSPQTIDRIARQENTMPASLLDKINETAMERMGDVLIETGDGKPVIIDFYEPELTNALR